MDKTQVEELRKLKTLLNERILSKEEFIEARDNILQSQSKQNKKPKDAPSEDIYDVEIVGATSDNAEILDTDYMSNEDIAHAEIKKDVNDTEAVDDNETVNFDFENEEEASLEKLSEKKEVSVSNPEEKTNNTIMLVAVVFAIVIALIVIYEKAYPLYEQTPTTTSEEPIEWRYDISDTKEMKYDNIVLHIPNGWDIEKYDDSVQANKEDSMVWVMIEDQGEFSSIPDFIKYLGKMDIPTEGEEVSIGESQYACKIDEYTNDDGEIVLACIVLADGKGYWVGGGAKENAINRNEFNKMLDSIELDK